MSEWISTKDRLPEENTPVLICTTRKCVWKARYYDEYRVLQVLIRAAYWEVDGSCDESIEFEPAEVTHWMPLPEPPEGERNG